jgi:hypothetical protein
VVNVRAQSCCFSLDELFGITHRARAEGLTGNENSVALTLFKSTSVLPQLCLVAQGAFIMGLFAVGMPMGLIVMCR